VAARSIAMRYADHEGSRMAAAFDVVVVGARGEKQIAAALGANLKLTPEDVERSAGIIAAARVLVVPARLLAAGVGDAIIDAKAYGNIVVTPHGFEVLPRFSVDSMDATGAGDAFAGVLEEHAR
jgi:sugar/nucleoside kinase (ribokinase family)